MIRARMAGERGSNGLRPRNRRGRRPSPSIRVRLSERADGEAQGSELREDSEIRKFEARVSLSFHFRNSSRPVTSQRPVAASRSEQVPKALVGVSRV